MKQLKALLFIYSISLLLTSCNREPVAVTQLEPMAISFVKSNGESIEDTSCSDAAMQYAVKIDAEFIGDTEEQITQVDFAVNGVVYNVSFTSSGSQVIPIDIRLGENRAEISGSNITTSLFTSLQEDFVEVN